MISNEELEDFWKTWITDPIDSSVLTQVFAKGPFAGFSVREVMEACVNRLGKTKPKVTKDHSN